MKISKNKKWFINQVGVAPVYSNSTFKSECVTELVFGESCLIIEKVGKWVKIRTDDKYEGFVNLFYGIIDFKRNREQYYVTNPDSKGLFSAKYPFGSVVTSNFNGAQKKKEKFNIDLVIPTAENLKGLPYRWGGKSSLGFDCSGLVQAVFKVCGLDIPRDSGNQFDFFRSQRIPMIETKPGDLHFFGKENQISHVGFSLGGDQILHSHGYVKEESIKANKVLLEIYLSSCSIKRKFLNEIT
jgi:cell wall-associated NlpC family hydrolase